MEYFKPHGGLLLQGRKNCGAMKKGKTWLIPAHAEKPVDNRFSTNKAIVGDNPELQGELHKINRMDSENNAVYRANDIYKNLGLTRETLRYYEEIGLIEPANTVNLPLRTFPA